MRDADAQAPVPHPIPDMPLSEEQTQAIATLAAADPKEVAEALRTDANAAYQNAYRHGRNDRDKEAKAEIDALTTAKEAAEAQAASAKESLDALSGKDADFAAERQRLEAAAQKAREEADAAKADAETRVKSIYQTAEQKSLLAGLVAAGVDKDYAEGAVLPKIAPRVRIDAVTEEGATKTYLGTDDVPLSGGIDALVKEAVASVPDRFKSSPVDAGGGATNSGGGAGSNPYKALQEAAKASGSSTAATPVSDKRAAKWGAPASA